MPVIDHIFISFLLSSFAIDQLFVFIIEYYLATYLSHFEIEWFNPQENHFLSQSFCIIGLLPKLVTLAYHISFLVFSFLYVSFTFFLLGFYYFKLISGYLFQFLYLQLAILKCHLLEFITQHLIHLLNYVILYSASLNLYGHLFCEQLHY